MSDLIQDTPAALEWAEAAKKRHHTGKFGEIAPAVIWTDSRNVDGTLRVDVDPEKLAVQINRDPFILLHNHDPGCPKGKLLESAYFESATGRKFVAAVLGYYAGGDVLSFRGLGIDAGEVVPPPLALPLLPDDVRIQIGTDARAVDAEWLDQITHESPARIERKNLSHNTAQSIQELIVIGLPYVVLVWNPFVKALATEAGKASYAGIHAWFRKLLTQMADRRDPITDFHSNQNGCQISFLFRGKDQKTLHAALEKLAGAATQAAELVSRLKALGMVSKQMVYEFDREALLWSPSFVILDDDRIITDTIALISIENLPKGLSLGLTRSGSL
ncbi:hypothetical protein [Pseudomonas amygdali]|nr:hypothetical protein [Pseudomonas amygdali]